jgi:hypothetical protein
MVARDSTWAEAECDLDLRVVGGDGFEIDIDSPTLSAYPRVQSMPS